MESAITRSIVLFAAFSLANCLIPSYISVCPHGIQNVSDCIINSIVKLTPKLKEGIEELGVPPLEPLRLGQITVDRISNGSRLVTNLTDILAYGASNFKILKLKTTPRNHGYTFRFEAIVPQLHIEGKYELDSQILFLDLVGNGPFNCNITDYHFECVLKGNKVKQGETNHLLFEQMKCSLVIGKARILLENLFNGNKVFADATNGIINDNMDIFFQEIKPGLLDGLEKRFTEISNKITLAFTYEELFP